MYDTSRNVIHPYRESWLKPGEGAGFSRTVWEHDGVIDIYFEALPHGTKEVYRLQTAVSGHFHKVNASDSSTIFVVQNNSSRMSILTSRNAEVAFPKSRTIDIKLEPKFDVLRVRVIL